MRQLAIIVIMAQMGSYVPAQSASLPLFDAIFLVSVQRMIWCQPVTFMMEMMEANRAIRRASERSLTFSLMSWDVSSTMIG